MDFSDGLYFGMPDGVYHSIPRLSASGIKDMRIHPTLFWAKSWMNVNQVRRETDAMRIGTAYHKRILEGRAKFQIDYGPKFSDDMVPNDCLNTVDDLKAFLEANDHTTKGKKSELVARVREFAPEKPIYEDLKTAHLAMHQGKELLYSNILDNIEISAAFIEKNPSTNRCFVGGYPEVVVLWEEQDVKFKARLDYLKAKAIVDLKTFSNPQEKPIEGAIYATMASRKYHIPASVYLRAAAEASRYLKAAFKECEGGNIPTWRKHENIFGAIEEDVNEDYARNLSACQEHDFYFVFQLTGDVPIAECYKFPRQMMWGIGETIINDAIRDFKHYHEIFGSDMWVTTKGIEEFDDSKFPVYATEL